MRGVADFHAKIGSKARVVELLVADLDEAAEGIHTACDFLWGFELVDLEIAVMSAHADRKMVLQRELVIRGYIDQALHNSLERPVGSSNGQSKLNRQRVFGLDVHVRRLFIVLRNSLEGCKQQ